MRMPQPVASSATLAASASGVPPTLTPTVRAGGAQAAYIGGVPDLDALLDAAVAGVGGTRREGQRTMAHAVADAVQESRHLLVQAGTGTGKSLAYLVPAIHHAVTTGSPAVVATATLALQSQIVERDLPLLAAALAPTLGRTPTFALVKGRANYVCLHKLEGGFPDDPDESSLISLGAVDGQASRLGSEVLRVRAWAGDTETGERDHLVPGVSERAWRQVSVSARECLGGRCPLLEECFVERARRAAREADIVVTNHAFLAIDAFEGRVMLPEHDLLVIDEGHELVARVTSTITDELAPGSVRLAARRAGTRADSGPALEECADLLDQACAGAPEGRLMGLPSALELALTRIRDTARAVVSELKSDRGAERGGEVDAGAQLATAAAGEVFDTAARLLEGRDLDVVWLSQDPRRGPVLRVAPMSVAMLVRDRIFTERTVVVTSATLELGGSFDSVARTLGLTGEGAPPWAGLDVGSPFDYRRQGIAYAARHLPPPGRDGLAVEVFDEIEELIRAAGGRTLGLFSSMRAAQAATEEMRRRFADDGPGAITVRCQGEDQTPTLVREFADDPRACLFGTLSLWQGVDVPGATCQLVLIDRIPFPRPDDPLSSARTQAIAAKGGNGFMAVAATHAALLLAQGAGRLIRRSDDRGVVAFLDSRMVTARYAGFLQRSLPDFWPTTDRTLVLTALQRLDASAVATASRAQEAAKREVESAQGRSQPTPDSTRTAVVQGHAWTADSDGDLRDGIAAGVSLAELADHLDLPEEVILARAQALGLQFDAQLVFDDGPVGGP